MLLSEAKKILKKNGYKLVEAVAIKDEDGTYSVDFDKDPSRKEVDFTYSWDEHAYVRRDGSSERNDMTIEEMTKYVVKELESMGAEIENVRVSNYASIFLKDYGEFDGREYDTMRFNIMYNKKENTVMFEKITNNQCSGNSFLNIQDAVANYFGE